MLEKLRLLAENTAKEAGALLLQGSESCRKINFKDRRDVKLQADEDSERFIRKSLESSGLSMIGEEEGGDSNLLEKDQYFWVIDPLDGTYNYLREQRETCVSIGLMKGSSFELGVIYDFNSDELITGQVGAGVYLNNELYEPKWVDNLSDACFFSGFLPGIHLSDPRVEAFVHRMKDIKKIRMIGSAALALATVGLGRADVYYEASTRLWDIAAGAAIVQAAGGAIKFHYLGDFTYDFWAFGRPEWINSFKI